MKHLIVTPLNRISYLLLFLLGGLFIFSSCKEEDPTEPREASGPPSVTAIRTTNPAVADSTFTQSTLGSTIVIVGNNLAATQYVSFNGYQTTINPVYATETHLIVRIPDLVPTVATSAGVSNELKVVNSAGEATYAFTVLPPAPVISAISNEFAKEGETITLFGQYFYFVKEVTFPGGVVATEMTANDPTGRTMTVKIPAGVNPAQGDVVVTSESGNSATSRRTKLFNNEGIIHNWDNVNAFGWGLDAGKAVVTSAPGIDAIDNKFGLISQVVPGGWGWNNDKVISMSNYSTNRLIPETTSPKYAADAPISNFDLKMEIAASGGGSLEGLELLVWIPGTPAGTVEKLVKLTDFVRSTDGKWYTMSVPLADLAASAADGGGKLTKYSDLNPNEIRIVIQNPTANGIQATLALDNFRIENMVVRQ
jgi:hypothetical protein